MTPTVYVNRNPDDLHRFSQWQDWSVTVVGLGIAGFGCADALMQLGARVTVIDAGDGEKLRDRAQILELLGATVLLGHEGMAPSGTDLMIVSPGLRPASPLIVDALDRGIPVWGELELAWRLRHPDTAAAWLCVTGTNGKTTTTLMLESMLRAAGYRTESAGNIGHSLVDVVMHDELDVIAVEVGAPQLPFVYSMSPVAAVCLNIADDHIDHFGSMDAYVAAKARIFERTQEAAVYNVQDETTRRMVEEADVVEGCRAIGFTLGAPAPSMLGVVDDLLVDRAFLADRAESAQELGTVSDVRPMAPHNVANALAAAALARAFGVPAPAIREGLRAFTPAAHRIATVGTAAGVVYIDDSKATNTHAARTSLSAYESVVWIAGGMAKGQEFDDLVRSAAASLRAVVLLGVDRTVIADALARHAPDVPVIVVGNPETGAMAEVVQHAASLAQPGDTVLLAPGCASWDMFRDYTDRGRQFADAVAGLPGFAV
ncbi:MAG: UDP-N-acetylmuramoyl-L-alanine--D-glutamate ligase [Actinobacteria bacterium]|nr:UDP-N-acetylmuramoyl-L-alanine--D-glutamate ligase [Actinomycetota bacterium]